MCDMSVLRIKPPRSLKCEGQSILTLPATLRKRDPEINRVASRWGRIKDLLSLRLRKQRTLERVEYQENDPCQGYPLARSPTTVTKN